LNAEDFYFRINGLTSNHSTYKEVFIQGMKTSTTLTIGDP
jgi:hypothetical protein